MQCGVPCPGPSSAPPEGCHSSATLEVAGLPSQWQQPRPPHPINTSSSAMASNFICCILHLKHWPPETFLLIIAPDRHQATFGGGERALISERRNLPLTACTTIMRDGNTDQRSGNNAIDTVWCRSMLSRRVGLGTSGLKPSLCSPHRCGARPLTARHIPHRFPRSIARRHFSHRPQHSPAHLHSLTAIDTPDGSEPHPHRDGRRKAPDCSSRHNLGRPVRAIRAPAGKQAVTPTSHTCGTAPHATGPSIISGFRINDSCPVGPCPGKKS